MKTGIVDVGGGLRGIYATGVFDYCLEMGIQFDFCIGKKLRQAKEDCEQIFKGDYGDVACQNRNHRGKGGYRTYGYPILFSIESKIFHILLLTMAVTDDYTDYC